MHIQANQKIVFIGDSVTDCERARPVGEGLGGATGKGYVTLVDSLFEAVYPERNIRVLNVGTSGNTVRDLAARWRTDVIDLKPDWLSIMIGINDVWRQFDSPRQTEKHVYPEEYERTLRELAAQTRPLLAGGLVLMTPFMIEDRTSDAMRARMDEYSAIVRQVAEEQDAVLVDTQAAFNAVLQHRHSASIAWDRIHPNATGHMILARAFLNGIGFDWQRDQ